MTRAEEDRGSEGSGARPELQYGKCGAYCGSCCRFNDRPKAAASRFLAIVEGSGQAKGLTEDKYRAYPPEIGQHWVEAKRHLTVLAETIGCWGCHGRGGPRDCEIRRCVDEKGVGICFDCPEFMTEAGPCTKFEGGWLEACNVQVADLVKNQKEYAQLGLEGWLKKRNDGFDFGWRSTRAAMRRRLDRIVDEIAETSAEIEARLAALPPEK